MYEKQSCKLYISQCLPLQRCPFCVFTVFPTEYDLIVIQSTIIPGVIYIDADKRGISYNFLIRIILLCCLLINSSFGVINLFSLRRYIPQFKPVFMLSIINHATLPSSVEKLTYVIYAHVLQERGTFPTTNLY